jgi:tetrahydromethanopterin S-methyltransferase subunit G
MQDKKKTKMQLIEELENLRTRLDKLEDKNENEVAEELLDPNRSWRKELT